MKKILIPVSVVLIIAVGYYFYSFSNSSTSSDVELDTSTIVEEKTEPANPAVDIELSDTQDTLNVTVEGGMFYFEPNVIEAKVGQKVVVNFKNVEGMHDFVIDELNAKTEIINAGEEQSIEFTPTEIGEFEYYCSVGNHRAQGMVGKLIVSE